jgi:hypothetical protein
MTLGKSLNPETFKKLAAKGLNCKEIARKMGYHPHTFGFRMKEALGVYPSVYIARMKNGKT